MAVGINKDQLYMDLLLKSASAAIGWHQFFKHDEGLQVWRQSPV